MLFRSLSANREWLRTARLLCELLAAEHVVLLVLYDLEALRVERLLELCEVDLW